MPYVDPEKERARQRRSWHARTVRWRAQVHIQKDKPCADCGVKYPPYVMDFDHVQGVKLFGISRRRTCSSDRLMAEIAKCDVVCSNCHRVRTHQRAEAS